MNDGYRLSSLSLVPVNPLGFSSRHSLINENSISYSKLWRIMLSPSGFTEILLLFQVGKDGFITNVWRNRLKGFAQGKATEGNGPSP
jgi:hypothetical protein